MALDLVMALDEATAALIAQSAGRPRVPELTVAQARQLDRAAARGRQGMNPLVLATYWA